MIRGAAQLLLAKRPWITFLALLALTVRSLIPAGFMVERTYFAGPTIVICTGFGSLSVHVDENGVPKPNEVPDHKPVKALNCAFAGFSTPTLSLAAQTSWKILFTGTTTAAISEKKSLVPGLAAPPPLKTGPPSVA